jgi:hypothetical protein
MTAIKSVSRFEANLLAIARFFVGGAPAHQALPLILQQQAQCPRLSTNAAALLQDSLAKGMTRLLARGGWRRERYLRANQIADGRLWGRTTPSDLGLHFSRHTLELLAWFTSENPARRNARLAIPPAKLLTAGDRLIRYHAYAALRRTEFGAALAGRLGFGEDALCWLAWPADFKALPQSSRPVLSVWTATTAVWVLEAMQNELASRLLEAEHARRQLDDGQSMLQIAQTTERVLTSLFDALNKAGRWDLARFVLAALAELLPADTAPHDWIGTLKGSGVRLADRENLQRAALVLPRQLDRLAAWQRQAQTFGYFDEDYAAGQLWKSLWDEFQGDRLCRRAGDLTRQMRLFNPQGGSR